MGTYDTRGGTPISPTLPDYSPSQLEEDVLGVLEDLDAARAAAHEVLTKVFQDLVAHRYPVGTVIELNQVTVLHGHAYGATQAKVVRVFAPELFLNRPEGTRVPVECVCLKKDGSETQNLIRFNEPVLTKRYEMSLSFDAKPLAPRDQLTTLLHELALHQESRPADEQTP